MLDVMKIYEEVKTYIHSLEPSIDRLSKIELVVRIYEDLKCLKVTNIMPTEIPNIYLIQIEIIGDIYFEIKNTGAYITYEFEQLRNDYFRKLREDKELPF